MDAKFCVIGKNLPHTLSPMIHGAFGRENYGVVQLANEGELAEFVAKREYAGFNVTIPYKRAIMPMLDEISEEAVAAGAVNTVVNAGGRLIGCNTDAQGMKCALDRAGIRLKNKNVLILGSGGTSHTASYLAMREGAKCVRVVSRTGEINYSNCYELQDTQVVINATPVGMSPSAFEKPVDVRKFGRVEGVFDAVYNPLRTLLTLDAVDCGIPAANGLSMLVEQARAAHTLFCRAGGGMPVDEAQGEQVRLSIEKQLTNIVFVGMAGAGKTAVGRRLAAALGREFADTDEMIVKRAGKDIPTIFREEGEEKFREYEREAVKQCCLRFGMVIALGGGAVENAENAFWARANGKVVYVKRDLEELDTAGRPLYSSPESVKALFEKRKHIYESVADVVTINDSDVEDAVRRVREALDI